MAVAANIILIILEAVGLSLSFRRGRWKILQFYTQLSNIAALLSSVLFLLAGEKAAWLRYTGNCMLIMTFFVSLFILVPMGAGFKKMMLTDSGLFHHTLCPILSVASYILWETHARVWFIPVILTFVYGMIMLYLNWKEIVDGPYPFFRVRHQSALATVLWYLALTAVITLTAFALIRIT